MSENPVVIPPPLKAPVFDSKIHNMMAKPNVSRSLIAVRQQGEELIRKICLQFQVNMIRTGTPNKHKWELLDGSIHETDTDFPPWKNFIIRNQDGKLYRVLPSHPDDPSIAAKDSIAATNWKNLALSSLEKYLKTRFDSIDTACSELKLMMGRVLQKTRLQHCLFKERFMKHLLLMEKKS